MANGDIFSNIGRNILTNLIGGPAAIQTQVGQQAGQGIVRGVGRGTGQPTQRRGRAQTAKAGAALPPEALAESIAQTPEALAQILGGVAPPGGGGGRARAARGETTAGAPLIPQAQAAQPSLSILQQIPQAGPATKAVSSLLDQNAQKSIKEQAQSALDQGQSPQQVLAVAQQLDQQTQQPQQEGFGLLNALLTSVGAGLTAAGGGDVSPISGLAQQRLETQKDLTKQARQATIDIRKSLLKGNSVDALSPKEAADFNLLIDGRDATANISNLLGDNITASLFAQGVPTFLQSQNARLLRASLERAVQAKTRIETGAALQPSELKSTADRFMPKVGDDPSTALKKLRPLFDFFEGSLNAADPTGVHRQRARGQTQQVELINEIQQEKARRGLI